MKSGGKSKSIPSVSASLSDDGQECGEAKTFALFVPHHDEHDGRGHNFKQDILAPSLRGPHGSDNPLICSVAASPAKTSVSPGSGPDLKGNGQASSLKSSGSRKPSGRHGDSSKMFQGCFPQMTEETCGLSSKGYGNAGLLSATAFWTASISESRNVVAACSLSAVLESSVSKKYFLSARAAQGILRRAQKRGRTLPPALEAALMHLASASQDEVGKTT